MYRITILSGFLLPFRNVKHIVSYASYLWRFPPARGRLLDTSSLYTAALYPDQHTMQHMKLSLGNSSFVGSKSPLDWNLSQYYQTVRRHLTSPRLQPDIDKQSTSMFDIMQFNRTTFMITRSMSTTFTHNISQPISSQKRLDPQSINGSANWSVFATAMMYLNLRRFCSEYAAIQSQTVSHNRMHSSHFCIGIYKRFFLPHLFFLLNPGNVGRNSEIADCTHHVYKAGIAPATTWVNYSETENFGYFLESKNFCRQKMQKTV